MRTRTVCIWAMAFALALSSASYGYQAHFYDEAGSYDYEYEAGTAHHIMVSASGDYAHNSSTVQIFVIDDEWGIGAACKDGYTGVYITDYDPINDPEIELHYWYYVDAWVLFWADPGTPGEGSGEAHALLNPGYHLMNASLSYSGGDGKYVESDELEDYVDMSYSGAEFEFYGVTYADMEISADDPTSKITAWTSGGILEFEFEIIEK